MSSQTLAKVLCNTHTYDKLHFMLFCSVIPVPRVAQFFSTDLSSVMGAFKFCTISHFNQHALPFSIQRSLFSHQLMRTVLEKPAVSPTLTPPLQCPSHSQDYTQSCNIFIFMNLQFSSTLIVPQSSTENITEIQTS